MNYFGKERHFTVLGMANNISKYNFVSDDLVSASASDRSAEMPITYTTSRGFNKLIYNLIGNLKFNHSNTLRITARSFTNNPTANMMQSVVNLNNPSYVRAGNPDINPSTQHSVEGRYVHTNRKKGLTFNGSVHFQQNLSIDRLYNDRLLYCDLFIGKKIFRNNLGEISIGVNDLCNATARNYRHSISTNGASDSSYLGIGRYFSVQMVYHLRH